PESLLGAKKRQNKITEYRKMLLAWKAQGVLTYAGYILGFPNDTPESILHDIDVIKRELPIDLLEFFFLTPLPGSEDHKKLHTAGVPMDPDMNKYDLNHLTTAHNRMTNAEWEAVYLKAWESFYTIEHITTVLRRAAVSWMNVANTLAALIWFKGCIEIERLHPLEGGFLRLKFRRDRRPGMPIVPAWRFYPTYWAELVAKTWRGLSLFVKLRRIYLGIKHDPKSRAYTDLALEPVADDETETHELYRS